MARRRRRAARRSARDGLRAAGAIGLSGRTRSTTRARVSRGFRTSATDARRRRVLSAQEGKSFTLRLAARDGRTPGWIVVTQEDGSCSRIALRAENAAPVTWRGLDGRRCDGVEARLPPLPAGRHHLSIEGGEACALTVAPPGCYLPDDARREFGLSAQLYSVRRDGDQGIGDFSTLARTRARWRQGRRGAHRDQSAARPVCARSHARQSVLSVRPAFPRSALYRCG